MAMRRVKVSLSRLKRELDRLGALMLADPQIPSITTLIAGAPVKGSWWGHPLGNLIYNLSSQLADDPDVLCVKLINKKVTYLTRRHWPALFSLGNSKSDWQMGKLTEVQKRILRAVETRGIVRADHSGMNMTAGEFGKQIAKMEERLLVYSESEHTELGKHVRIAMSWKRLANARGFKMERGDIEVAKTQFDRLREVLSGEANVKIRYPWE